MSSKEKLTYSFLRGLTAFLSRLPHRSAAALGSRVGSFAFRHLATRKEDALRHLRMAFPDRPETLYSRILRNAYNHFGQVFVDILRFYGLSTDRIVSVENRHCIDDALSNGKGVLLVTGHLGNWEMIPLWLARKGYPLYAVVRRQKNRGVDRFFLKLRRQIGTSPIYVKKAPGEITGILQRGGIVGLASDQDARRRGVFVQFFGIPTSTPRGAAVFHLKTRSPVVMAICFRNRDGTYRLKFEVIPTEVKSGDAVTAITQRFTTRLEYEIRNHPEQYFWFHRRWKTKPSPGREENVQSESLPG